MFGYNHSEVEKKSTPNSAYNMKPAGLLIILILFVKKGRDKGDAINSSGNSS